MLSCLFALYRCTYARILHTDKHCIHSIRSYEVLLLLSFFLSSFFHSLISLLLYSNTYIHSHRVFSMLLLTRAQYVVYYLLVGIGGRGRNEENSERRLKQKSELRNKVYGLVRSRHFYYRKLLHRSATSYSLRERKSEEKGGDYRGRQHSHT